MTYCCLLPQKITHSKIRRPIESFIKEWPENFPKEMSVIQNKSKIHG